MVYRYNETCIQRRLNAVETVLDLAVKTAHCMITAKIILITNLHTGGLTLGTEPHCTYPRKLFLFLVIYPKKRKIYSKIPLLRPPKIETNSPLKSIFKKCQSFFLCVFCTQCLLERYNFWDCSKVVLKTTFEKS